MGLDVSAGAIFGARFTIKKEKKVITETRYHEITGNPYKKEINVPIIELWHNNEIVRIFTDEEWNSEEWREVEKFDWWVSPEAYDAEPSEYEAVYGKRITKEVDLRGENYIEALPNPGEIISRREPLCEELKKLNKDVVFELGVYICMCMSY